MESLMETYCVKFLVLKSTEWYSFAFLETIMECFKTNLLKKKRLTFFLNNLIYWNLRVRFMVFSRSMSIWICFASLCFVLIYIIVTPNYCFKLTRQWNIMRWFEITLKVSGFCILCKALLLENIKFQIAPIVLILSKCILTF